MFGIIRTTPKRIMWTVINKRLMEKLLAYVELAQYEYREKYLGIIWKSDRKATPPIKKPKLCWAFLLSLNNCVGCGGKFENRRVFKKKFTKFTSSWCIGTIHLTQSKSMGKWLFENSSFNLNWDLVGLWDMIKAFSLKLSREARERLAWMDCYRECGNASLICRKFGIARKSFYRWRKRYDPWDLTSLESFSRRPKHSPRMASTPNLRHFFYLWINKYLDSDAT